MIPSKTAIETAFVFFNKKYFGNELPMPTFSTSCPPEMWGTFIPARSMRQKSGKIINIGNPPGVLALTSMYSRAEKSILNTLLHEMVHMYVFCVKKIVLRNPHGTIFQEKANEINKDGWNIMAENQIEPTDKKFDGTEHEVDNWSYNFEEQPQSSKNSTNGDTGNNQKALLNMLQQIKKVSHMIDLYKQNLNK